MADHPRTLIRQRVKADLLAAPDSPALGAYLCRSTDVPPYQLPCFLVYDDDEKREGDFYQGRPRRVLELTIEGWARGVVPEDLEVLLDQLALTVERTLENDPRLGGLAAMDLEYQSTEKLRDSRGKSYVGVVIIKFEVTYMMPEAEEDAPDDFLTFRADYDLAPADGTVDASDTVTLPQE